MKMLIKADLVTDAEVDLLDAVVLDYFNALRVTGVVVESFLLFRRNLVQFFHAVLFLLLLLPRSCKKHSPQVSTKTSYFVSAKMLWKNENSVETVLQLILTLDIASVTGRATGNCEIRNTSCLLNNISFRQSKPPAFI